VSTSQSGLRGTIRGTVKKAVYPFSEGVAYRSG
jgi:hypothetical protein